MTRLKTVAGILDRVDPLGSLPEAASDRPWPWFAYRDPASGVTAAAFGSVRQIHASGEQRFDDALASLGAADPGDPSTVELGRPRWWGGFAFTPRLKPESGSGVGPLLRDEHLGDTAGTWGDFPDLVFHLPAVQVVSTGDVSWLTVTGSGDVSGTWHRVAAALQHERSAVSGAEPGLSHVPRGTGGGARSVAPQSRTRRPEASPMAAVHRRATLSRAKARVTAALRRIGAGDVTKLVVSVPETRPMPASPQNPDDLGRRVMSLARKAIRNEPDATVLVISPNPATALMVATPETLVRRSEGTLYTEALAGTTPRFDSPEADAEAAQTLRHSDKDRREHAEVVEAIRSVLSGFNPRVPEEPEIRRLARLQHLHTPIRADAGGMHILSLGGRLHPTPALAGHPRSEAVVAVTEIEGEDRGWYGGAAGWFDASGDGHLAVLIRGVLVGEALTARAGAGVVAGSDPDAEAAEIGHKLDSIWSSLGLGGVAASS